MKKNRQIHLWVGLICSVFVLLQSVTGLLLLEPWLIGGGGGERGVMPAVQSGTQSQQTADASSTSAAVAGSEQAAEGTAAAATGTFPAGGFPGDRGGKEGGSGVTGFIKNLHEGRIGSADISWLLDIAAIGMIILTVTGIILSVKTLKAQQIRRKKLRAAA